MKAIYIYQVYQVRIEPPEKAFERVCVLSLRIKALGKYYDLRVPK